MKKLLAAVLLFSACCVAVYGEGTNLAWGIDAAALSGPLPGDPHWQTLLSANSNVLELDHFYRLGGENRPATPTECRVAYNSDALYVVFRCSEPDMSYPAQAHRSDWYTQIHNPNDQDATFPDKVDIILAPNLNSAAYYQFAATLDGRSFAVQRRSSGAPALVDEEIPKKKTVKITDFETRVIRRSNEWIAYFRIPWRTIGGQPANYFGFIPVRTRWRDSETTTPVAANFMDRPALDSCIEVHFTTNAVNVSGDGCLVELPSGVWRWRRPVLLTYPDRQTLSNIWQMQQGLNQPTGAENFAERILLTQRWTDLLELEGFQFRPGSGSIAREDLSPSLVRWNVNAALREGQPNRAWALLDRYLKELDPVSRKWFADESAGLIRAGEWTPVTSVSGIALAGDVAILHCQAGTNKADLRLSFPASGGFRLYNEHEGFFKPAALLPATMSDTGSGWLISSGPKTVFIWKAGFEIQLSDVGPTRMNFDQGSMAFRFGPKGEILAVDLHHPLERGEVVYGFGERYDSFNQNGNVLTLWGADDWFGNTAGLRNQTYKPIPILHSSSGYMMFVNSSYRLRADIGKSNPKEYRLTQAGPILDDYIWLGPPENSLKSYTDLTGKPILPPRWAFEPWMGRTGRGWSSGPKHDAVAEEEQVVKRFAELDIPHSAIYSEGPGAESKSLNAFMAARHLHVLSWYFPAIGEATQTRLLPDVPKAQLPVLNPGYAEQQDPINYVDFSNPNAMELSRRWWKRRLDLGVAGSMVDFGDRTPESAVFFDGRKGAEMHNAYSYDYQHTYHDVFAERRGDDFILFGRAASPGTQKWVAQFGGDHRANFVGLQAVLTGALNLCSCGFSSWGSDLGGFMGWPDPDVYMRWTQFACFSPLMRSHGRTPREPWEYGDEAVSNYKHFAWVRENLLDYIYHAAENAHESGIPIMRSLAVAYPSEESLSAIADEYMFGPDLLVTPIVNETNRRTVYFPPGRWVNLWDGVAESDRATLNVPLNNIPVFLRPGASMLVNLSPDLEFGQSLTAGKTRALVLNPSAKKFILHDPDAPILLIYGADSAKIYVDGNSLPHLLARNVVGLREGWRAERTPRRLVVRLPLASHDVEIELETEQGRPSR